MAHGSCSRWLVVCRGSLAVISALLVSGATLAAPPSKAKAGGLPVVEKARRSAPARAVKRAHAPTGVGTLQYDNDIPAARDGNAIFVGNLFNSGGQDPHSIASVSFRRGGAQGSVALAAIFDVPIVTLGYVLMSGLPSATSGTQLFAAPLTSPVLGHSGAFIGALFNSTSGVCAGNTLGLACDGPALTAGTMDPGMGFHAVRLYATGTSGVPIPNRNAIFRVTGDNLPVELMGLVVE